MKAIYKKDVRSAFNGMTGWVLCAFVTFIIGLYFTAICLGQGYTEFGYVLSSVTFIYIVIVPLLTMRSVVEERRQKTDQLLLTSPTSIASIVWGKYFALLTVYAIPLCIAALCPLVGGQFGPMAYARSYMALGAFFLLGAAAVSIGLFMSSLTESQIISAVMTFGALLVLYLMPSIATLLPAGALMNALFFMLLCAAVTAALYGLMKNLVLPIACFAVSQIVLWVLYAVDNTHFEGSFATFLNSLALFDRFNDFVNGIFNVTSLVYFISVALLFVFLTCQSFEKRRWS